MLESIPQALWPALLGHIYLGVQKGSIDSSALWHLCFSTGSAGRDSAHPSDKVLAWARARVKGVPPHVRRVTLVPPGSATPEHADKASARDADADRQLPLAFAQEAAQASSAASLEVSGGMPAIVAAALALVLRAPKAAAAPALLVHPALTDDACDKAGKRCGRALLGLLAEMGLASRPWHLWIGPTTPQARLSPYVRDLGEALTQWGLDTGLTPPTQDPDGAPATDAAALHAVALDAVADAFVATHEGLAQERQTAGRAVGITQARLHGIDVAIMDLGRAVPELWDARLPKINPWAAGDLTHAPLLVQITPPADGADERTQAALVARLCHALGITLQSVVVCQDGQLTGDGATHLEASSLCDSAFDRSLPCGSAAEVALACVDAVPYALADGAPMAHSAPEAEGEPLVARATVPGGAVLWARLVRLQHRGVVHSRVPLHLHVVQMGNPYGADAVATAHLRRLLAPSPLPAPRPNPPQAGPDPAVRRGRALRA